MKFGLREIIFVLLLMAIPIGAWQFVFRPNNARAAQMRQQIESRQVKIRELNQTTASIGDIKEQIAALEEAVGYFQSKLPNEKKMDKVLQEIWVLAADNELSAKSVRALDRNKATYLSDDNTKQGEQPINVQLEGDFMGFYSFLLAIENQPRITRIRNMTLTKNDKGPRGSMQADFDMSVFFERSDPERQ